ncbi:type IX secretion system anionic LPS delivery protein PorZ [Hymenobacter convexus]|uniref:type IX secretion system anionic LPS delivery protein PorZ n=1 Tax=Hymenobacter sp. CA1UV-4 TaxID=3063782 RepID=UPI002713B061|nr:two-component regulator propeller domain-containing protein [Hymenobacter sp. CA1UV-4]MDO7853706.1 two-component regulator propeller domain-containing protein [Hymenobacter sp. CA1UV-4]
MLGLTGLFLLAGSARAQGVGYGDWQLHLPINRPLQLADAGDRVYVSTQQRAFYFLDKKLNTTQVLSRRDGLSGVGVAGMAYDSVTRQTVLAYNDTNLDVLQPNGKVRNINDVLRKVSQGAIQVGSNPINRVSIGGGRAYVSTTFGLVALDLTKLEISDTYSNIGPGGTVVNVYDAASANGFLFVATSVGLLRGSLSQNLLDYRNWTLYQPVPPIAQTVVYRFLAVDGGQVYAAVEAGGNSVYKFVAGSTTPWQQVPGTYTGQFRSLRGSGAGLLLVDDDYGVRRLNRTTGVVSTDVPPIPGTFTEDAVRSRDGNYYVANFMNGLFRVAPGAGKTPEYFVANGPQSNLSFSILADARSNKVDVFSGAYGERYGPNGNGEGFYEFFNGQWTNITAQTLSSAAYPNPIRPVRGARTPDGTLYVGYFGGGLLEWKGPSDFRLFNPGAPVGTPLLRTNGDASRTDVTDLAATPEGKLWVVNRHLQPGNSGLFLFDPAATTWQTIPFSFGFDALERIALDDLGNPWVSVSRKTDASSVGGPAIGLYAVDATGANPPRLFNSSSGLPDNQIYELAKDRRGYIWAATIKGVAYFREPEGPFGTNLGFTLPFVNKGEGVGYNTLYSEAVRCMAVDGADRKWFGTDRGLWLFSPDADEALLHFTTANSPLPSDRIVDVKVNDKTGEVWVATEAGVVAYRGSATVTEGKPNCTAVFPNPVRPDFAGTVGITGLTNNALVKITDVAGHLVYATTASGGTVTWNMTNPNGERVRSGVYLVLSTDADGKNGCVSKVAVLSK